jgi:hypothetical protein
MFYETAGNLIEFDCGVFAFACSIGPQSFKGREFITQESKKSTFGYLPTPNPAHNFIKGARC